MLRSEAASEASVDAVLLQYRLLVAADPAEIFGLAATQLNEVMNLEIDGDIRLFLGVEDGAPIDSYEKMQRIDRALPWFCGSSIPWCR